MSLCQGWSLVRTESVRTKAITLYCRSWLCPDCMPKRLRQLKRFAAGGNPSTFMTLTVSPRTGETIELRARALADGLKLLIKRARRKWTKGEIEYMAIFEETKKGEPHLHILMRAPFIPQRWLSQQMDELIAAPIVDIRRVASAKHAAAYVAKYVAKGPKAFGSLKRYWSSQGYNRAAARKRAEEFHEFASWIVEKRPLWTIRAMWELMGWQVIADDANCIMTLYERRRDQTGPPSAWPDAVRWADGK